MEIKLINKKSIFSSIEKNEIIDFLYEHLGLYTDPRCDIVKAIEYALSPTRTPGGFILIAHDQSEISGVAVILHTSMEGYIPENILVYIAVRKEMRGTGIGKKLMKKTIEAANGNIALHVEPENPARFLYQKIGFENKYLEMRLIKN